MVPYGLPDVTAVILAGGLGTRLRSVVSDRPKVLADVYGRPFLTYLLDHLSDSGIRYVVLCTGYLGEQVEVELGSSYGNLHLAYSLEPSPLGTAGALRLALPLFRSDMVLVLNGDSFCDVALGTFWEWHHERHANASIALTRVPDAGRYGWVEVDADGRICCFKEKVSRGVPGWINAGVYLLGCALIRTIPEEGAVSLEREIFPARIGQGLYGYRSSGRFLDIGTPESFAAAERFFA